MSHIRQGGTEHPAHPPALDPAPLLANGLTSGAFEVPPPPVRERRLSREGIRLTSNRRTIFKAK